jgi:glutathione synthase/RimK-type ligase-like ATP-grasp enzyme
VGESGSRAELEKALRVVDSQLRGRPNVELSFQRARILDRLGRADAARHGYVAVLQRDPNHFAALTDLGTLLYKAGLLKEAVTCFESAVAKHPGNAIGHANLAFMLLRGGDPGKAREHYEAALAIDPSHLEAHRGLALALAEQGETERAREHREAGFRGAALTTLPYRGAGEPIRVLVLVSASPGNTRTDAFLDDRIFAVSKLVVEYYDSNVVLPEHDLAFNAVGDADICADALRAVARVLELVEAPVINPPSAIAPTGRAQNAARLAKLEGVIAPRTLDVTRAALLDESARESLAAQGLHFPLLVRSPGYHAGKNFERVERPEDLPAALAALPGNDLIAIEFVDTRGPDAKVRKYRAIFAGGAIYPLHLAIAAQWKVHYFSADMAENSANRVEEEAFLAEMPRAIGPRAMAALERVQTALGLDFGGIDFALAPDGRIVVFEANATMVVPLPDDDERWAYRVAPVERIYVAVREMLQTTAGKPNGEYR